MRDTTRIMAIAQESLADLADKPKGAALEAAMEGVLANLREIVTVAKRMDARTGTSDPSEKKVKGGGPG